VEVENGQPVKGRRIVAGVIDKTDLQAMQVFGKVQINQKVKIYFKNSYVK
jgi:hypothetical protein